MSAAGVRWGDSELKTAAVVLRASLEALDSMDSKTSVITSTQWGSARECELVQLQDQPRIYQSCSRG